MATWEQADHVARGQLMAMFGETPESLMPEGLSREEYEIEFRSRDPEIPSDKLEESWRAYQELEREREAKRNQMSE